MPIGDVDPGEYYLPWELDEFKALFNTYDTSGDGCLQSTEIMDLFKKVGINLRPYQLDSVIREFDNDDNGEIDFEEFVVMMIKLTSKKIRADCIDYNEYLTPAMLDKYEKSFRHYDVDHSGSIGKDEIEKMFKDFGLTHITGAVLDSIIDEVDKDKSGEIEFDEFCAMMSKVTGVRKKIQPREYLEPHVLDKYRVAFNAFDVDRGGSISVRELDQLLRRHGVHLPSWKVDQMLAKYDSDASGELDFSEFAAMMVDLKKVRRMRRINPGTHSAKELRQEGFSADEVKRAGFDAGALRSAEYSAVSLLDAEFKTLDMRRAGFSAVELRRAGLGASELKRVGYSLTDLRNAGYSHNACSAACKALDYRDVPYYDKRRLMHAPNMPDHCTPRVRYMADTTVAMSKGLKARETLQRAGRRISVVRKMIGGFGGGFAGMQRRQAAEKAMMGAAPSAQKNLARQAMAGSMSRPQETSVTKEPGGVKTVEM
jgi:Ca2+-binding EF-hand superfamily protein